MDGERAMRYRKTVYIFSALMLVSGIAADARDTEQVGEVRRHGARGAPADAFIACPVAADGQQHAMLDVTSAAACKPPTCSAMPHRSVSVAAPQIRSTISFSPR